MQNIIAKNLEVGDTIIILDEEFKIIWLEHSKDKKFIFIKFLSSFLKVPSNRTFKLLSKDIKY